MDITGLFPADEPKPLEVVSCLSARDQIRSRRKREREDRSPKAKVGVGGYYDKPLATALPDLQNVPLRDWPSVQ